MYWGGGRSVSILIGGYPANVEGKLDSIAFTHPQGHCKDVLFLVVRGLWYSVYRYKEARRGECEGVGVIGTV